ncbi:MAG: zinc-binding dehydrogenase [Actinobacteria bacterium]|nr:zinc-binding dehydrogenase [Actinomycetota bacterium]
MRALVTTKAGDLSVLQVREWPDPSPGPGEVLVKVEAAGLNFADTMARKGIYPDAPPYPAVMGYEVAGTVAALGEGVDRFAVGDRVLGATHFGGQAELAVTAAGNLVPVPEGFSFEQAAAVPVNYATAWAALVLYGNVQPGDRVLVHAAAGGVGTAALQVARTHGAEVYGAASPAKHDAVLAHGAAHAIDYTSGDWWKGLPEFDLILDPIGGKVLRRGYRLLRPGGRIISYGVTALAAGERRNPARVVGQFAQMPLFHPVQMASASKGVIGLNMLRIWDDRGTLEQFIAPLQAMFDDRSIDPVVAATFPFERAADAHRLLLERGNVGKVVLTPG